MRVRLGIGARVGVDGHLHRSATGVVRVCNVEHKTNDGDHLPVNALFTNIERGHAITVAWLFGLGGSSDIFESLTSKCVRV